MEFEVQKSIQFELYGTVYLYPDSIVMETIIHLLPKLVKGILFMIVLVLAERYLIRAKQGKDANGNVKALKIFFGFVGLMILMGIVEFFIVAYL